MHCVCQSSPETAAVLAGDEAGRTQQLGECRCLTTNAVCSLIVTYSDFLFILNMILSCILVNYVFP